MTPKLLFEYICVVGFSLLILFVFFVIICAIFGIIFKDFTNQSPFTKLLCDWIKQTKTKK